MFDPTTLVGFHTWLSLIALMAGLVLVAGALRGGEPAGWTGLFLVTAVATSVTGFLLPASGFLPSHGVGILALIVLVVALAARYRFGLAGRWRPAYTIAVVASTFFLAFVALAQAFLKVPALNGLAPTGTEPPFALAQGALLAVFLALGFVAVRAAGRRAAAPV